MNANEQALSNFNPGQPWNTPWPENELESVPNCPVCANASRSLVYKELVDRVFYCAAGKWTSWRCAGCHSTYLDPRPSPASIHLAYEAYYTHGGGAEKIKYADLSWLRRLRRRLVNGYTNWRFGTKEFPASSFGIIIMACAIPFKSDTDGRFRHLPGLPAGGGAVLDIGCGGGSFLRIAQECGWDVTGIDPDPKAVANCRSQGLNVQHGGLELFDGKECLFDVITMSHVIEHVHHPVEVMKVCHRLLKPGGRFWIETPNVESLEHRLFGRNWLGYDPPRHLVLFNPGSMTAALSSVGFSRQVFGPGPTAMRSTPTMASEAVRQGLPVDSHVPFSLSLKCKVIGISFLQLFNSGLRGNINVIAFKTED